MHTRFLFTMVISHSHLFFLEAIHWKRKGGGQSRSLLVVVKPQVSMGDKEGLLDAHDTELNQILLGE
jgi:hypothetical protein